MDRPPAKSITPPAEPAAQLPPDLDEDPGDESIYSLGYRARVGAVVAEPRLAEPRLAEPAEPASPPTVVSRS